MPTQGYSGVRPGQDKGWRAGWSPRGKPVVAPPRLLSSHRLPPRLTSLHRPRAQRNTHGQNEPHDRTTPRSLLTRDARVLLKPQLRDALDCPNLDIGHRGQPQAAVSGRGGEGTAALLSPRPLSLRCLRARCLTRALPWLRRRAVLACRRRDLDHRGTLVSFVQF